MSRLCLLFWFFFGAPLAFADMVDDLAKAAEIYGVRISPTGEYLAAIKEEDDKRVVAVFTYPKMKLINVIDFPGRSEVGSYWWVNDERILVNVAVDWGNREEDLGYGELYAVNADGKKGKYLFGLRGDQGGKTKTRLNNVSREFASASFRDPIWDNPKEVLIQIRDWSRGYKDVISTARLNLYNGRVTQRLLAPRPNSTPVADKNGEVRFAYYTDDDFNSIIFARDEEGEWYEFSKAAYGETQIQPIELADNGGLYVYKSEDGGPRGLYLMNADGEFESLYSHEWVDVAGVYSDYKGSIYGALSSPDYVEQVILDNEHPNAQLLTGLADAFPDGVVAVGSTTHDFRLSVVLVAHPLRTTELYIYDRQSGELKPLFDLQPWIDDERLPVDKPIKVTARDGTVLHGYLGTPRGVKAEKMPMVIIPHGGPHGPRDFWGMRPFEAIYAVEGYAVLRINYRGSGGYGQAFENAGFGEWANKMQDDLTDSVKWAIEEGIADPDRICIAGWSYGGYATAMSLAKEPDLYKCGIAGAGVYDQDIQYRKSDFAEGTRWGPKYIDKVIGPTAEDRRQASPTTFVNRIKAPLLLIHGEDDRRVPIEHAYELQKVMKKAGKPVPELIVLENEGHSPAKEDNRRRWYRASIDFVEQHIGPGVTAGR